jgi:hypothetical protein
MALRLLRRGAVAWVLLRTMLFFGGLFTRSGEQHLGALFVLDPRTMIGLFAVIGIAAMIDTRRKHEHAFLANLGVSQVTATVYLLVPTLIGELALGMVIR